MELTTIYTVTINQMGLDEFSNVSFPCFDDAVKYVITEIEESMDTDLTEEEKSKITKIFDEDEILDDPEIDAYNTYRIDCSNLVKNFQHL